MSFIMSSRFASSISSSSALPAWDWLGAYWSTCLPQLNEATIGRPASHSLPTILSTMGRKLGHNGSMRSGTTSTPVPSAQGNSSLVQSRKVWQALPGSFSWTHERSISVDNLAVIRTVTISGKSDRCSLSTLR